MIHAGQGEEQINNFLSELNLPTPSSSTLKQREEEVGAFFEKIAKKSMNEALAEEVDMDNSAGSGISVAADVGWQKRGAGRAYNSLTGIVDKFVVLFVIF